MKINNKKGFTLIELMVVIAIIGILATAGISMYTSYQMKSRDTVRIQTLGTIDTALASYYNDFGKFPIAVGTSPCLTDGNGVPSSEAGKEFSKYFSGGKAPLDPSSENLSGGCQTKRSYGYKPLESGGLANNGYYLVTNVEDVKSANTIWTTNLTNLVKVDSSTAATTAEIGRYAKGTMPGNTPGNTSVYAKLN